jgi:hypothetical protein
MSLSSPQLLEKSHQLLQDWLLSCTRSKRLSRNTIAVGIVVLHHLKNKSPVNPTEVISPGGEIIDSRGKLHQILRSYGVTRPEKYLKEVTTRQAHPDGKRLFDAFEYGAVFTGLTEEERQSILVELIEVLIQEIDKWFLRQNLKINFERHHSPSEWVRKILEEAKGKSGGVVEQHLVGAKLQTRHADIQIANLPGHAADVQTGRPGDFVVGDTVYHVTVAPSPVVVQKCGENISAGLHPILLVPYDLVSKTKSFAEYAGLEKRLTVIAIEDFVALNIIEMANDHKSRFFEVLNRIIDSYNERLQAVETDMSLKIDVY